MGCGASYNATVPVFPELLVDRQPLPPASQAASADDVGQVLQRVSPATAAQVGYGSETLRVELQDLVEALAKAEASRTNAEQQSARARECLLAEVQKTQAKTQEIAELKAHVSVLEAQLATVKKAHTARQQVSDTACSAEDETVTTVEANIETPPADIGSSSRGSYDLLRYNQPESIWEALAKGNVCLVRSSWLIAQSKAQHTLAWRRELPEEAFMGISELTDLFGEGNRSGVLPIINISFCWLTSEHPDPEGKQLTTVAAYLEREQPRYKKFFKEMGVFWDWLSLYEKNANYVHTTEEREAFGFAFHETMDLWYAHQGSSMFQLTKLSMGSTLSVGCKDADWTVDDQHPAERVKKLKFDLQGNQDESDGCAEWKFVLDLCAVEESHVERRWSTGSKKFNELIETKNFRPEADKKAVNAFFGKMSSNQFGGIVNLSFSRTKPKTLQDVHE